MKTKITLMAATAFCCITGAFAQVPCTNDLNGFVNYKNTGTTGSYQLSAGFEEKASQAYNYAGPGKISSVRVYGSYPVFGFGGVPLKIGIYNADLSGRPTTAISTVNHTWWSFMDNSNGYIDVTFPNGVAVSNKFAITVEIRNNIFPNGTVFDLRYTGNGEGGGQDLASLAGTSTGFNWTSAKNSFNKDGDFYLVPTMAHLNIPSFTTTGSCYSVNSPVSFSNTTQMTMDSMFNKIALAGYAGSNHFYTWNFGDGSPVSYAVNPSHVYSTGGVYTATLTTTIEGWSGSPCVKTYTRSVSVGLNVTASSIVNVTCFGGSNGSFVANGQFGAPTRSFSINGSLWQTSTSFTGLNAGNYTLYVKDAKGCTNSTNVSITQPSGITFNSIITSNASCNNANGSIISSATGGISPLQYKLDNGSFQSTGNFSGLLAQTHTLVVSDANSCTTTTLVVVNNLGGPVLGSPNITNVSCYGGTDGSITLSSSGGTGSMQYSINGGTTFQTSPVFSNIGAGAYICVVKDNAGCTSLANVTIGQGQLLGLSLTSVPAVCNGSANGQITATSTGGTGTHNYSINGINYQSGTTFSGLSAGTYTVYVKDVTGCIKTTTIVVAQPPVLSETLSSIAATCYGLSDGAITALGSGGNGSFLYSINGIDFQSVGTFIYLPAGTYTVTAKDMFACTTNSTVTISQPSAITTTVNTTNSTCTFTNGSIMVLAAGGSGSGYQYSINGGANYFTSGLFSNLIAGTKYVVVKDGSGCQVIVSGVIVDSNGPTITSSSQQNVSCNAGNDGNINITSVTGGSGLLQYSKNGINWQSSPLFINLTAGVYVIQVKDANGCTGNVTKTITQPNGFLITSVTSSVSCFGNSTGSSTIAASGGAGFLVYSINGGSSYQSAGTFNNLSAGFYNVMVKDAANCVASSAFLIVEPSKIEISGLGVLNVTCNGANNGAISVAATGGYAPYLYSLNFSGYSPVSIFSGLAGNVNYIVSVKDANNCVIMHPVIVTEPDPIVVTPIINTIKCSGGNNGAISLNVIGGVAPYIYQWSNGAIVPSIFNLGAGVYSVSVADYNGCTSLNSYTLVQPSNPLIVNGVVVAASATGSGDGSIDVTVSGGVGPYTFNWSNGAITEDVSGLNPGTYLLTITDANGCATSSTFIVDNITGIAAMQITGNDVSVYPNPSSEYAIIEAKGFNISRIEVIDLLGKNVLQDEVNSPSTRIGMNDLLNGTYFVKIYFSNSSNVVIKKIVVSK